MLHVISNGTVSLFEEIYRFPQLPDFFVRVHTVCHIPARVAENTTDGVWIRPGVIKQGCAGMATVVCGMSGAADGRHDALPKCTVAGVGEGMAVWIGDEIFSGNFQPCLDKWPYPIVDGNDSYACVCLGFPDIEKSLPLMYVCFPESKKFINSHTGIDEY